MARARCPRSSVEAGQKCVKIEGASKSTSHSRRDSDNLQYGELRSYRGSRLVKFFLGIFINFTDIYETGESFFFIFFILLQWAKFRFEKGKMYLTVTSLQCQCLSWLMIDQGNLRKSKATKKLKPNKKETTIEGRNPCDSEIPEWLQEFRENLVDDEIPLQGGSHASSSHEVSLEPTTKRREDLGKHNVHTHFLKDRNCEICKRTKITRAPCRRRNGEAVPRAVKFGDLITADHKVLSDNCESRNNHRYAVVVQDLATQWIQAYPCKNKTSQETQRSLQKFLEPERKPKVIYTDNSLEFGRACEDLSLNHCTSTPHRSETNGIAERAVRRVKEGTSAVLLQSGLNESWWADSMECFTCLRNVTDLLSDGKTPYERRFGQPLKGPIIPFGSLVEYHPITAKDQSRIHQFGKKVLPGLFLGYALYAGVIWKGDVLIETLRSWKRWTHRKSTRKDSMRKR